MRKRLLAFTAALALALGLAVPAFAAEETGPADAKAWQDGVFNGGVYEGFYAQLDDLQKMIYDKIKEAFAEPVKEATLTFDEPIVLEAKEGAAFTGDDLYQWMCDNMYHQHGGRYAVFRDHPEMPWLLAVDYGARALGDYIYNDQGVCTGFRMTGIFYENTYPWVPPEAYTNPDALKQGADAAVAAIGEARPTRAETLRAIHDYLCGLVSYGERTESLPDKEGGEAHTVYYDHTAYSLLAEPHEGVCNAYAAAYKLLCDRYGIPCVHLSGATTAGNHAWNYVQMEDGSWYSADITWSDGESIDYTYFLAGKDTPNQDGEAFAVTHAVPAGNEGLGCPELSDTAYSGLRAPQFTDVPPTAYYADAVTWAVGKNITSGTSAATFSPDSTCNRAQILTFLWRANGSPEPAGKNPFSDVSTEDYYCKAALWAAEQGLVSGPVLAAETDCTRLEAVTYLYTLAPPADIVAVAVRFLDVPESAMDAVSWAAEHGITAGISEGYFGPDLICTRGQIMTFLYHALGQ